VTSTPFRGRLLPANNLIKPGLTEWSLKRDRLLVTEPADLGRSCNSTLSKTEAARRLVQNGPSAGRIPHLRCNLPAGRGKGKRRQAPYGHARGALTQSPAPSGRRRGLGLPVGSIVRRVPISSNASLPPQAGGGRGASPKSWPTAVGAALLNLTARFPRGAPDRGRRARRPWTRAAR
jgi:hypothetical protein